MGWHSVDVAKNDHENWLLVCPLPQFNFNMYYKPESTVARPLLALTTPSAASSVSTARAAAYRRAGLGGAFFQFRFSLLRDPTRTRTSPPSCPPNPPLSPPPPLRYTLKTSRPPPRGFDAFFAFAKERRRLVDGVARRCAGLTRGTCCC